MPKKKSIAKPKKTVGETRAKTSTKASSKTASKSKVSTAKKPVKKPAKKATSKPTKKVAKKSSTKGTTKAKVTSKASSTSTTTSSSSNGIGQLNETALHAALKHYCASADAEFEVKLDGYYIDVVEKNLLIEIQTRNFSAIKPKLKKLLTKHKLLLVHPIAKEKWILKQDGDDVSRRKSPKRGKVLDIFDELIRIPELVKHKNFSLQVLLISSEESRLVRPKVKWRDKGWTPTGKRLLEVHESHLFKTKKDYVNLLPKDLPSPFTTADLVKTMKVNKALASKIAFCLRKMGIVKVSGKQGRFTSYKLNP